MKEKFKTIEAYIETNCKAETAQKHKDNLKTIVAKLQDKKNNAEFIKVAMPKIEDILKRIATDDDEVKSGNPAVQKLQVLKTLTSLTK